MKITSAYLWLLSFDVVFWGGEEVGWVRGWGRGRVTDFGSIFPGKKLAQFIRGPTGKKGGKRGKEEKKNIFFFLQSRAVLLAFFSSCFLEQKLVY